MCSITNTAHPRSTFRAVTASPRMPSLVAWCLRVVMFTCCHVVMFTCLYVVGRHSLVFTVIGQKGACNQGKGSLRVVKYQFTRRHSFCNFYQECTLPRFSRNRQKKTLLCNKVLFISPIRNPDRLSF